MRMRAAIGLAVLSLLAGCAAPRAGGAAAESPRGGVERGAPLVGDVQRGRATYYADRFTGRRTASGERYDPSALTAAHRTLPFGTVVEVARDDGRRVVVRINDRGPFGDGSRVVDLSRAAAAAIDLLRDGVADVTLRVLVAPPARARR